MVQTAILLARVPRKWTTFSESVFAGGSAAASYTARYFSFWGAWLGTSRGIAPMNYFRKSLPDNRRLPSRFKESADSRTANDASRATAGVEILAVVRRTSGAVPRAADSSVGGRVTGPEIAARTGIPHGFGSRKNTLPRLQAVARKVGETVRRRIMTREKFYDERHYLWDGSGSPTRKSKNSEKTVGGGPPPRYPPQSPALAFPKSNRRCFPEARPPRIFASFRPGSFHFN